MWVGDINGCDQAVWYFLINTTKAFSLKQTWMIVLNFFQEIVYCRSECTLTHHHKRLQLSNHFKEPYLDSPQKTNILLYFQCKQQAFVKLLLLINCNRSFYLSFHFHDESKYSTNTETKKTKNTCLAYWHLTRKNSLKRSFDFTFYVNQLGIFRKS